MQNGPIMLNVAISNGSDRRGTAIGVTGFSVGIVIEGRTDTPRSRTAPHFATPERSGPAILNHDGRGEHGGKEKIRAIESLMPFSKD